MNINCSVLRNALCKKLSIDEETCFTKDQIHVKSIGAFAYQITIDGCEPFKWCVRWHYDHEYKEYFITCKEYYGDEVDDMDYSDIIYCDIVKELSVDLYTHIMVNLGYHIAMCF